MAPYNMSKAAVRSFSETLYAELGPEGIDVSVVMPTFFKTNIMQHSRTGGEEKEVGEMMMAVSELEADKVAQYILKKAGKKRPYIILPAQARWLWRLKRWIPESFLKISRKVRMDKDKFRARLEKRYKKVKAKESK
jgi:short-subunit dehydrogenase